MEENPARPLQGLAIGSLGSFELRERMQQLLLQYEHLVLLFFSSIQQILAKGPAQAKKLPTESLHKPENLMMEIIELDRLLQSYVTQLCFYQQKKKEIELGEEKLNHGQKSIATLATDLVQLETHLLSFRDRVMGHLNAHEKAKNDKLEVSSLLSYAQRISHMRPVASEPFRHRFPVPEEDLMRGSILFTEVSLPEEAKRQLERQGNS